MLRTRRSQKNFIDCCSTGFLVGEIYHLNVFLGPRGFLDFSPHENLWDHIITFDLGVYNKNTDKKHLNREIVRLTLYKTISLTRNVQKFVKFSRTR